MFKMLQPFCSCPGRRLYSQLSCSGLPRLTPCAGRQHTRPETNVATAVATCEHGETSDKEPQRHVRELGSLTVHGGASVAHGCRGNVGRQLEAGTSPLWSFVADQRVNPVQELPRRQNKQGANGRPWSAFHARLQNALRSSHLLDTDSVLLAVSGGQDSVCMLHALADLQPRWRWRLGVVHCDHRWREDSAANAEFVRQLVEERLGLPFYLHMAPPGAAQSERGAREWRYAVFAEVAAAHGYSAVATAHTATDRAETLLLNLLRGAGPDGLVALARSRPLGPAASLRRGGPADRGCGDSSDGSGSRSSGSRARGNGGGSPPPVRLVRPLLEFTRSETQAFTGEMGLPYFHDSTNDCNDMRRNLLRNQVLPGLRQHFNPRLDQALFRFMEVLDGEMQFLSDVTDALYGSAVVVPAAADDGGGAGDLARGSHGASDAVGGADAGPGAETGAGGGVSGGVCEGGSEAAAARGLRSHSGQACAEALDIAKVRALPLALQRRVVHMWLRSAVRGVRGRGGGANDGGSTPAQAQGAGRRPSRCREVGYEDVARCLALLDAPNRAVSDSLCGGLVATVSHGLLVLEPAGHPRSPPRQSPRQAQHRDRGLQPEAQRPARDGGGTSPWEAPADAGAGAGGAAAAATKAIALAVAEGRLAAASLPDRAAPAPLQQPRRFAASDGQAVAGRRAGVSATMSAAPTWGMEAAAADREELTDRIIATVRDLARVDLPPCHSYAKRNAPGA